jgi:hypothetical protein
MPTSPSCERPILRAIQDLRAISETGRVLYFAVDAMSPSYLRRLSEAITAHGIEIRWSATMGHRRLRAHEHGADHRATTAANPELLKIGARLPDWATGVHGQFFDNRCFNDAYLRRLRVIALAIAQAHRFPQRKQR